MEPSEHGASPLPESGKVVDGDVMLAGGMPSEGAGAAAGAGLANTTIADGDIATAVAVLQALGRDEEAFFSKRCQALRRALGPLQQLHESRKFGGMSHEAYNQSKQQRLQETMSRQKQRMLEKEFINKTQLRAARLAKLAQLSQQDDGSGTLLLIPDGVADDSVPLAPHLLMDASPLPVAGEASSSSSSAASSATPAGANGIEAGSADGGGSASGDPASGAASGPAASSAASSAGSDGDPSLREPITLERTFRACYSCKRRYQQLHAFYATFCPTCAAFNWAKRHQTADLSGRVALVTGARVKIGFQVCLKLLRAGCEVVATSRFPHDAAERYAAQPDFASWSSRLHVFGVDLRDLPALEAFCEMMHRRFNRLDVLINNACQTVRRPPAFYAPLLLRELTPLSALPPAVRPLVAHAHEHTAGRWSRQLLDSARGTARVLLNDDDSSAGSGGAGAAASVSSSSSATPMEAEAAPAVPAVASAAAGAGASALAPAAGDSSAAAGGALLAAATGVAAAASAAMSQLAVVPGDEFTDTSLFPTGLVDVNGQQIDLREKNSWTMRLHEVSTPELAEVFCINSMAPFILNARLKPLMMRGRDIPADARRPSWKRGTRAAVDALAKLLPLSLREAMLGSAAGPSVSGADGEEVDAAAGAGAASSALSSSGGAGKAGAGGPPPSKRPRREGVAASSSGSASAAPSLSGVHRLLGEVAGEVPESVCRFIINVSAMEGKFNRSKTPNHPQTNMAKAALNMMTRTSAQDYAEDLILMNCVDTGWINEENPAAVAARTAAKHDFQTPIDEVDAAARILDPVFAPLAEAQAAGGDGTCRPVFGGFLKDYYLSEW